MRHGRPKVDRRLHGRRASRIGVKVGVIGVIGVNFTELDEGYFFPLDKTDALIADYAPKDRKYIGGGERDNYSLSEYRSERLAEVFQAIEMDDPDWWDIGKVQEGLFTITLNYLNGEDERDRIGSVHMKALIERI